MRHVTKILILFYSIKAISLTNSEIGIIYISQTLFNNFQYSTKMNLPIWDNEEQVWIYPSLNIDVTPTVSNSNGQIQIDMNINITGNTTSGKEVQLRRNIVGASTKSTIRASLTQPLFITNNGIIQDQLHGIPEIETQINTYNSFKLPLLSRIAHRRAMKEAIQTTQRRTIKAKHEITDQVKKNVTDTIYQSQNELASIISKINPISSQAQNEFPFSIGLRSQKNLGEGFIEVTIRNNTKTKEEPPKIIHQNQMASSVALKEELLKNFFQKLLAGKEMRIIDLKKILCDSILNQALQFCKNSEKSDPSDFLSILFDKNEPIDVSFNNNIVSVKLNAIYQIHKPEILSAENGPLLRNPTDPKDLIYGNVPYIIEFSYKLKNSHAELINLRVKENIENQNPNTNHHITAFIRPTDFMSPIIKKQIEARFRELLKEKVEYPKLNIPTKITTKAIGSKNHQVIESGSLIPLEIYAKDGWFYTENYFCINNGQALGISFRPDKDLNGNIIYKVTQVTNNSPAALNGIKEGDMLTGFGENERTILPVPENYSYFLEFISNKAKKEVAKGRIIFLNGIDKDGKKFQKEIILCPI